jgi:dolichyl-phosphate-mannose-protein mannosyltransferase
MKRQRILILLAVCLAAAALLYMGLRPQPQAPAELGKNLLVNGDFSQMEGEYPVGWDIDYYWRTQGITSFDVVEGRDGQGVRIINREPNDARYFQAVQVQPNTLYCLSGYIRASAQDGRGANLSIEGGHNYSDILFDTAGEWQQVKLYGRTGKDQTQVTVFARLGGYSGEATGEAMFDDLRLEAVSEVPDEYYEVSWEPPAPMVPAKPEPPARAAWPWLMLIALCYAALAWMLAKWAQAVNTTELEQNKHAGASWQVAVLLLAALLTRIFIVFVVPGYGVDIGCFTGWANRMAEVGPANFYLTEQHSDYPPGYMLALWPLGALSRGSGGTPEWLVKLPSVLADVAAIYVLYRVARSRDNHRSALLLAALYAAHPLTYVAGAAWGQVDSLLTLLLVLTVLMAIKGQWIAALPIYVLAVLVKPQALMFGPIGLAALIMDLAMHKDKQRRISALWGAGISALVALVVVLPFVTAMEQPLAWLIKLYSGTMTYYGQATVNATNLYFLFGLNWVPVGDSTGWLLRLAGALAVLMPVAVYVLRARPGRRQLLWVSPLAALSIAVAAIPMSMSLMGTLLMVAVFYLVCVQFMARRDIGWLPFFGATMLIAFCSLGTMMHERYVFPAILLLLLAYVCFRDRRILGLMLLVSVAAFLNVGIVLDRAIRIGGPAGHLTAPYFNIAGEAPWVEYLAAVLLVLSGVYALYLGCVFAWSQPDPVPPRPLTIADKEESHTPSAIRALLHPKPLVRTDRKDWIWMLAITAIYSVVAFTNLGSTRAPQNAWVSREEGEMVAFDLGEERTFNILTYAGIHWSPRDFTWETSTDGETWTAYNARVVQGNCFSWRYQSDYTINEEGNTVFQAMPYTFTARYLRLIAEGSGITLNEMLLRDAESQQTLPVQLITGNGEALIDEQDTLVGEPSWYNSAYFDEIYHPRTALEHRNAIWGIEPNSTYEVSHPPLGKLFMTFSIMIFGMTPFGWRFAGALAGVLMLPGMYLLGRLLTKRRLGGIMACLLMALDAMHFTQTRIATIDSFVTLFIIWSFYYMFRYALMPHFTCSLRSTLRPLALSGLFMGLAIASKWTGMYAGVGLAVIFFWTVVRQIRQGLYAQRQLPANQGEEEPPAFAAARGWPRRVLLTLAACVGFFVLVPALIYYVSFIPWFMRTPGGITLQKVWDASVSMYNYHAKPGFGMDHPYYSPWYEWPLSIKPMWYFAGKRVGSTASTIFAFGTPAVWWVGLLALLAVMGRFVAQHIRLKPAQITGDNVSGDHRPALLILAFCAQYLPWVLVPRGTYIYHYFPSVPFIILCIVLVADWLQDRFGRKALPFVMGYLVLVLLMFIAFFPYMSGVRVPMAWLDAMKWFPNWLFY